VLGTELTENDSPVLAEKRDLGGLGRMRNALRERIVRMTFIGASCLRRAPSGRVIESWIGLGTLSRRGAAATVCAL
jgi:hypothetical protein